MNRKKDYKNLDKHHKTCRRQKQKYYRKTQLYEKRLWSCEEDKIVSDHNMTDTEISYAIGRSVCAIQVRRSRLKRKAEFAGQRKEKRE